MKKCLLRFLVLVFGVMGLVWKVEGQNLVPNGSFEDTIACPNGGGEINKAMGWSSYSHTPDYYNSCNTEACSVPSNFAGYQYAKAGNAYAGEILYYLPLINEREDIGIQLTQPLSTEERYYVSFYVVMAFKHSVRFGIATNKIGIRLSTVPFSSSNPVPIDNYCQVYSDSIITDTLNWTKISGSFVADSAYSYFIIGNFFSDSLTSRIIIDSTAWYSYYYIDDIRFSTDSNFVISTHEVNYVNLITIYPNPFTTQLQIHYTITQPAELMVYDKLGRKVKSRTLPSNQKIVELSFAELPAGIYLVAINRGGQSFSEKVVKE